MADVSAQPFSIDAFKALFRNSRARKYLSRMEVEQIHTALEDKNVKLLETLYGVLLQEKTRDEEIVRDFVMTQNRIMDEYNIELTGIKKKYVDRPLMEESNAAASKEKAEADEILKKI